MVNVTHFVLSVLDSILSQEFQLRELKQLISVGDCVESGAEVLEGLLVANGHESGESIALAGAVGFRFEKDLKELWGIGNEGLGVLEDGSHGPCGVLSHVGVTVFQT